MCLERRQKAVYEDYCCKPPLNNGRVSGKCVNEQVQCAWGVQWMVPYITDDRDNGMICNMNIWHTMVLTVTI